jgi:hypothetical protein
MKRIALPFLALSAALWLAVAWAQPASQSPLVELPGGKGVARSGACAFPIGGWTIVNCSNAAAAQSSALNPWSRYVMQCGVNSYVAWGDAATDEADSSDGYLPAGSWLEFMTTASVRYASCLNIGSDSDCRIIECL